ncbi:hypothetical protein OG21DRAFT_1487667 [Imleria badia]|nr:hypothetical protein OG21DRAFT_1487667 [Imleria badia]
MVLLSKQAEAAENGELSESEDKAIRAHRNQALKQVSAKTLARYKQIYAVLIHLVPGIKLLISDSDDSSRSAKRRKVLKKINHAMNEARSNDITGLREKIIGYATPNPRVAPLSPPIPPGSSRSQMGLNHPVLAGYLCPVEYVKAFDRNPEGTRKKLEDGKIKMSSTNFPALLWEDCGRKFNEINMLEGFFQGFYMEQVIRHIFTGPSTGYGDDVRGSKPSNSDLHHMDQVGGAQLAYAAVHARFGISSKTRWSEKDGALNYRKYYYALMDIIEECEDIVWKEELLKHYNVVLFKDEKGRQNDFDADDEEEENMDGEPSNNCGFFSRMRAQVAARVSSNTDQDASNPGFGSTSDSNMATEQTTHAGDGSPVLASGNPPAPRPHTPPATSGQATSSSLGPSSHTPPATSGQATSSSLGGLSHIPPAPSPRAYPAALPDHSSNSTIQTSPRQPHASLAPMQNNVVPQPRAPTPMSDLSDVEALEECHKRATIKKGKRKAVVGSDEEGAPAESSKPTCSKRARKVKK